MTLQDLMMLYGVTLGKRRTAKPVSYTHLVHTGGAQQQIHGHAGDADEQDGHRRGLSDGR